MLARPEVFPVSRYLPAIPLVPGIFPGTPARTGRAVYKPPDPVTASVSLVREKIAGVDRRKVLRS